MVKKMNELAVTIKNLLEQGFSQTWIARKLNIRRQKVNYWAKNPIKSEQKRRRKLGDKYIKEIISLAENKTTSSMSSNKISNIINKKLKEDGTNLSITKMTVCRILNKELGKPRKIKRVFYLSKKNKMKRVEFCKKMIEKNISGKNILFTDEAIIDMGCYTHDSIRLSDENKIKLKKGDKEAFKLVNKEEKKFEPSILIAGGICSGGLTDLIINEGTLNEFAYAQVLLFYKDSYNVLKKKFNNELYFEQDGASAHTSRTNKIVIEKLFGKNKLIQNPPNSPDLAYPIEYIWAYIKPRIKRKNPQTLEDLKKFTLEEWNAIPKKIIDNCGKNYKKRLEKVIELEGERLEPVHLQEIKRDLNEEEENTEENMEIEKEGKADKLKMKITYNDAKMNFLRKKEIKDLKKKIKEVKNETKEKIKKTKELKKKIPGIAMWRKKRKEYLKQKEEKDINALEAKIEKLEKMGIVDYLKYTKELYKKKKKKEEDEESTIDESIEKIMKIKNMINEDPYIKYELEF